MGKVHIKGGVWKNTEDEILKVAVMKYGKNQWARISSLLTRKTPKQCKARWFDWLDPSIRKTEWSKEEDEKLLHLAKLMPTQWRTIAPVVGRTAAQCLERYQKLLDEAEAGTAGAEGDTSVTGDTVRRLRAGEIDPDPETKPARPDPVDMDDDEKEMLSEARARLANTQGKKAKRKARERQLLEAKRLAIIQKHRDLKAAGITFKIRRIKPGETDYNADIPFHRQAPMGFWDVTGERNEERVKARLETREMLTTNAKDGKRPSDREDGGSSDAQKQKKQKESRDYVPPVVTATSSNISERKRLVLPAPQISESEIHEIVKIGAAGEVVRSMVDAADDQPFAPSNTLLTDYSSAFKAPTPVRTLRTNSSGAVGGDSVRQSVLDLKRMTQAQTPLLGEDVDLESVDFARGGRTIHGTGVLPPATPNALLTAFGQTPRPGASAAGGVLPGRTPGGVRATPLRDSMGINARQQKDSFSDTPRSVAQSRQQLSDFFKFLPKPKNDFDIVLPETGAEDDVTSTADGLIEKGPSELDMSDVEKGQLDEMAREEEAYLARRPQSLQRSLPQPILPSGGSLSGLYNPADPIESLIFAEYEHMLAVDPLCYVSDVYMKEASVLVQQEIAQQMASSRDELAQLQEEIASMYIHFPASGRVVPLVPIPEGIDGSLSASKPSSPSKTQVAVLSEALTDAKTLMKAQAIKAQKSEKKLSTLLAGYQARSSSLSASISDTWDTIVGLERQRVSTETLRARELVAIRDRIAQLQREVEHAKLIQRDTQDRYRDLLGEKEAMLAAISGLV